MADTHSEPENCDPNGPDATSTNLSRVLPSTALFGKDREVWIEHDGTRYRLRITKRNKLLLQK
ncbi:MAG TPA: hemin uptake protein HemP [Fimbriiglobus sp.]